MNSQLLTQMLPYWRQFAITPDNAINFTVGGRPVVTRGLYVGVGGSAAVVMQDGTAVTLSGLTAGAVYTLRLKRVNATGTTAGALVGLY